MSDEEKKEQKAQAGKGFPFTIVRHVVQVLVFLLFLVPVLLAGWGLFGTTVGGDNMIGTPAGSFPFYGTLSSSELFGIELLDPFAALQAFVAAKAFTLDMLIGLLPPLIVYLCMCTDEFAKMPFALRHYKSGEWIRNLTREL